MKFGQLIKYPSKLFLTLLKEIIGFVDCLNFQHLVKFIFFKEISEKFQNLTV